MGTPFPPGATGGFPTSATSAGPVAVKRHRGGTILVLALLAAGITLFMMTVERRPTPAVWFIPFLPALIAWLMGVRDGREMKNGSRDPAGQGVTKVGKVIALINLLLLLYLIIGGFIVEQ
jgi:hypothetical protein